MSAILQFPSNQIATSVIPVSARPLTIAVAGNPNAGKTSLFNALTGLKQKVANYPGVTVESKTGKWSLAPDLPPARLIDLPGLYSLDAMSLDEQIARDVMLGCAPAIADPDVIVVAVDATNLVRNLYVVTQLIESERRIVVALTMFDLAERSKLAIDVNKLSDALGVPVVPVVARQRRGIDALGRAVIAAMVSRQRPVARWRLSSEIEQALADLSQNDPTRRSLALRELFSEELPKEQRRRQAVEQARQQLARINPHWRQEPLIARYDWIEHAVNQAVHYADDNRPTVTERIDALVTHKIVGPLILLLVMLLVFQTIFSWANLPMNLIDHVFSALGDAVRNHFPAGILTDLLVDGIIAGVGGVLVFLPQILLLFFFISILEDSGYMARAAFLTDRLMRAVGLNGKAFMPLLSSFACAVPGIMATRTIENPKDRIATIMIAPFMSCSARLPVYTLMIAACFADRKILGILSAGVVIILAMYLLGISVAIVVAGILKSSLLHGPAPPFVMELPPYRIPQLANVANTMIERAGLFVKRAGTVILAISILLWALVAFPHGAGTRSEQVQNSFAGRAGHVIEPVIAPLGFDWKIGIGLISSFAARETIVSTLSIVYNVGADSKEQPASLVAALRNAKRADGSPAWTPLVALSLMVFFVLACQCMSTLAVVRRETNSWRWPLFMLGYMLVLAYLGSLLTYQGGRLLGFS
ncbi:MAG TPA: ferrous iron transport protein B [Blastocatellia bacterium]|jgi:ferrous iron transport protein B|nr:ferrous iron transport protein B [Blastocatellia bacterium]